MSLDSFVQSFTLQPPTERIVAGMPVELIAAPTEILDVAGVEVVTSQVDLQMVFKHVQLPAEDGVTAWPPPAAPSAIASVTSGLAAAPQAGAIEGWLATITGTVPVGTRDISDQIRIDFRWLLTDLDTSTALADFSVLGGGLNADRLTFAVPPIVTELTATDFDAALAQVPAARRIGVQVVVRGRIGVTADTGDVTVPAQPLEVPLFPIPVPSVAALFRNTELAGDAVLLMVPRGSAFSSAQHLMGVLTPLREVLQTVETTASVAAWATGTRGLFSAVDALAARVPLTTHVGFLARDDHNDLGKYNFIVRDNWWNTDIEDRASSCILISANRAISFFQHDDFNGSRLDLDARPEFPVRFGGAAIRTLHVSVPASQPPGCVTTTGTPSGGTWGDVISSYRWRGLGGSG